VSRRTIYRWHQTGALKLRSTGKNLVFTEDQLRRAEALVSERKSREKLMDQLTSQDRTEVAAKKFIQRRLKRGRSLEQIAREYLAE
jgi:hypothetical protein